MLNAAYQTEGTLGCSWSWKPSSTRFSISSQVGSVTMLISPALSAAMRVAGSVIWRQTM